MNVVSWFVKNYGAISAVVGPLIIMGWSLWHATQMNEIEVLMAGNEWQKKKDIGRALVVFLTMYFCNWSMGLSMSENVAMVLLLIATLFLIVFVVCLIINAINKSKKVMGVGNAFLLVSIFFTGWLFSWYGYSYVSDEKNTLPSGKYVVYLVFILAVTLMVGLCTLLFISTIKKHSRILLRLRDFKPEDKELYVYSRVGEDLICGTDSDIYKAKDIIIVPAERVKEKGYSYCFTNITSDESGEDKKQNKKSTIINIEADSVIVTKSEKSSDEKEDSEA
ncbi:hypothetical protein SAMN04487831_1049 [Pseudobutyrivibrio sp. UC1225]|uniref:hypothetical protein n=1 Tax=Pseudobutyrivibrio sp. UC1225 TaxID=1798185 RepID=UPI0008E4DDDA|nr:hypothetical protein [Pseudobutyrivibrio sp. UC1225]SFN82497.1 hypothetical protein SAMN04487831_1049 [Pseudobutyrivibrio sp. UC1225]